MIFRRKIIHLGIILCLSNMKQFRFRSQNCFLLLSLLEIMLMITTFHMKWCNDEWIKKIIPYYYVVRYAAIYLVHTHCIPLIIHFHDIMVCFLDSHNIHKLLIVSDRYRIGTGQVPNRYRIGTGQVPDRYRIGIGQVPDRYWISTR